MSDEPNGGRARRAEDLARIRNESRVRTAIRRELASDESDDLLREEERAESEPAVIELSHVYLSFDDRPILEDVSLEARHGETLVLVGESGTGKSTALKLILRLLVPHFSPRARGTLSQRILIGWLRVPEGYGKQPGLLLCHLLGRTRAPRCEAVVQHSCIRASRSHACLVSGHAFQPPPDNTGPTREASRFWRAANGRASETPCQFWPPQMMIAGHSAV